LQQSDVFQRYPKLRIQVCHCGGSVSRFIPNAKPSGEAGGGSVGIGAKTEAAHADEGIDLRYPSFVWKDAKGHIRGCACEQPDSYPALRADLGVKE
jgi:hypothetical protein